MSRWLKIVVSTALIAWLVSSVDFRAIWSQFAEVDWIWFFYAALLIPVGVALGVWRWQVFLAVNNLQPGFTTLVNFWLVGQFFSNFLPSNVGGDVVKATMVARRCGQGSWPHAASSVLVARVVGLLGMFVVLPLGIMLNREWVDAINAAVPLAVTFAGLLVLVVLIFSDVGNSLLRYFESVRWTSKIATVVRRLHDSVLTYRMAPAAIVKTLAISGALTLETAIQIWLLIHMFPDVDISWSSQILVFTVSSLVAMMPFAINGYGLQEGAFTVLLVSLGLTPGQGLIIAVAYRLISLLVASAGGLVFALSGTPVQDVTEVNRSS
jgi:uncharacterized protein (TIRG00374 family)